MKSSIKKILDIADRTLYNWKKEQKPIVLLLEKYFTKEDLEEFLDTGEIRRFENYDASRADPLFIEYIKYNLPTKIDAIKGEGIIDRLNRLIPRKIFISILEDLRNEEDIELYQRKSKKFLIDRIKGYEASLHEGPSKKQLVGIIEKTLSNIECYVLIKYHEEILAK